MLGVRTYHNIAGGQHSEKPSDSIRAPTSAVAELGENEFRAVCFWLQSQQDNENDKKEPHMKGENGVLDVGQNTVAPEVECKRYQGNSPIDTAILPWLGHKIRIGERDQAQGEIGCSKWSRCCESVPSHNCEPSTVPAQGGPD